MELFGILSQIWKFNAEIERDRTDGKLIIKNIKNVPHETIRDLEKYGAEIDKFIHERDLMSVEDKTLFKIHSFIAGWQPHNKQIEKFLNEDFQSMKLWFEWSVILANNGYKHIYEDYRPFENEQSNQLKKELYQRAVNFSKGAK